MGDIKVGYEALDTAAADIRSKAISIEDKLDAMEKRMEGRADQWTGAASVSFTDARVKWESGMATMKEILNDIGHTVGLSNEEYRSAEAANAKRFGG